MIKGNSFKNEFEKIKSEYYKENPIKVFIEKNCFAERPLVLYGCGALCRTVIYACNDLKINVVAVCDTYKTGIYGDTGLQITSPEQLKEKYLGANILICSYRFAKRIKRNMDSLKLPRASIFEVSFEMTNLIHPKDFEQSYLSGYEWAYNFFTDDISKRLILDRIKMYFTGAALVKNTIGESYFEPGTINLTEDEVFVDGGAFVGDTAEEFIKNVKNFGGYRHIYSFEPDSKAFEIAVCNLSQYDNVNVIGKGLWSDETELKFFSDGGNASSTFVNGVRTISVPVTSIDRYFAGKPDTELPTFIKMDIEGAEKEALVGAENVIRKMHPKLAICVYHKPEDIYELPKLIHDIDPSYQFTLRQCADGIYDTVLYAI